MDNNSIAQNTDNNNDMMNDPYFKDYKISCPLNNNIRIGVSNALKAEKKKNVLLK